MEKIDMESGTTVRPPAYVSQTPPVVVKNRKKTAAIVGTVVACTVVIAVSVALCLHYLKATVKEPHTFNIHVKTGDREETDEVSIDPKKQQLTIKYQRTEDGRDVIVLEDIKNGFMASKESGQNTVVCLVSPIAANRSEKLDFDKAYEAIENTKKNGVPEMTGQKSKNMEVLTDHIIHPMVLRNTAGDAIAEFCSKAESYWMIEKPDGDTNSGERQKRGCNYHCGLQFTCCPWGWRTTCGVRCTW